MSSVVERLMAGFQELFFNECFNAKTIIDLGCGFGTWGHTIRSMVIQGGDQAYIVGCDVFRPFLVKNKNYNPYDDLVLCDARFLPFQPKCANIVLSFEMIEHLDKKSGYSFLENLDKLATDRLVLSTPYGYLLQHDTDEILFEEHKSVWSDKDFEKKGFKVRKSGIGLNLEMAFGKHSMLNIINKIALLKSKNKWTGIMILAEKHKEKQKMSLQTYEERVKLAIGNKKNRF
jgi:SAM-dependent methyltransferase